MDETDVRIRALTLVDEADVRIRARVRKLGFFRVRVQVGVSFDRHCSWRCN